MKVHFPYESKHLAKAANMETYNNIADIASIISLQNIYFKRGVKLNFACMHVVHLGLDLCVYT